MIFYLGLWFNLDHVVVRTNHNNLSQVLDNEKEVIIVLLCWIFLRKILVEA